MSGADIYLLGLPGKWAGLVENMFKCVQISLSVFELGLYRFTERVISTCLPRSPDERELPNPASTADSG